MFINNNYYINEKYIISYVSHNEKETEVYSSEITLLYKKGELKKWHLFGPNEYYEENIYCIDDNYKKPHTYDYIKDYLKKCNYMMDETSGKFYKKPHIDIMFPNKTETIYFESDKEMMEVVNQLNEKIEK